MNYVRPGTVVGGTLRYLAPERVEEALSYSPKSCDRGDGRGSSSGNLSLGRALVNFEDRMDVYAFAFLLWELTHERRAYEGMTGADAAFGAGDTFDHRQHHPADGRVLAEDFNGAIRRAEDDDFPDHLPFGHPEGAGVIELRFRDGFNFGGHGGDEEDGHAEDEEGDAPEQGDISEVQRTVSTLMGEGSSDGGHDGATGELLLLEAGCGVGNTLFPLLRANPRLRCFGVDFADAAIAIVRRHPFAQCGRVSAAVGDLTCGRLPAELAPCLGACDVATLMFVLSAISPERMRAAVDAAASALREGVGRQRLSRTRRSLEEERDRSAIGAQPLALAGIERCEIVTPQEERLLDRLPDLDREDHLIERDPGIIHARSRSHRLIHSVISRRRNRHLPGGIGHF
jgi:SAM-dependent methyltransferase